MRLPSLRKILRIAGISLLTIIGLSLLGAGLFALKVFSREPLQAVASTNHPVLDRQSCVDCHAPIAEEWKQSYHYKSVTGPYWEEVRQMGYIDIFEKIRKPCTNCHAPANVLDLADATAMAASGNAGLGIECTPNMLQDPEGIIPSVRSDDVEFGVDCVSCHVSRRGILGPGRHSTADHETLPDRRFQDPAITSGSFCITCHGATVRAWQTTAFAEDGVSCLDCHMPMINAPSVAGGPDRQRRSHQFVGDKDEDMLRKAVNASLEVTGDRKAKLRITNDRVGHYLPSGANWLLVYLKAHDEKGQLVKEHKEALGREETLLLDFWPFNEDKRIAFGTHREIVLPLPNGSGSVEAVIRYWDWMNRVKTIVTLTQSF